MSDKSLFERQNDRIKEMTPKTGFNVVGVDKFEQPGDELYLVKHCKTKEEAEKVVADMTKKHPRDDFHVYGVD